MNNAALANDLRNRINLLAAEYRAAEATETRAELRCRMGRINALEDQLTALAAPEQSDPDAEELAEFGKCWSEDEAEQVLRGAL